MDHSLTLLQRALEQSSQQDLARKLGVHKSTLSKAKERGSLSPSLAGAIAIELHEPAEHWIAVAGLEQERASSVREKVIKHLTRLTKLYCCNPAWWRIFAQRPRRSALCT